MFTLNNFRILLIVILLFSWLNKGSDLNANQPIDYQKYELVSLVNSATMSMVGSYDFEQDRTPDRTNVDIFPVTESPKETVGEEETEQKEYLTEQQAVDLINSLLEDKKTDRSIVVLSDYNCAACVQLEKYVLEKLESKYTDKIKLIKLSDNPSEFRVFQSKIEKATGRGLLIPTFFVVENEGSDILFESIKVGYIPIDQFRAYFEKYIDEQ